MRESSAGFLVSIIGESGDDYEGVSASTNAGGACEVGACHCLDAPFGWEALAREKPESLVSQQFADWHDSFRSRSISA